ncbi:MAG: hypothetical protein DWQ37_01440 [Planctomycetota bacterium]|nr:MAG: hypothetical protein DWQ37_01440 [Planctomycetota bacterium]
MFAWAAGTQAFGEDILDDSSGPVFRPPLIKQVAAEETVPAVPPSVPTSRWDAQEPVQTPEGQPITDMGTACDAGCVSCEYPGLQWVVGIEQTFLWPQLSRTFLETGFTNSLGSIDYINDSALGSVDGAYLTAPRFTLGVRGECWGLVGRYWDASAWANTFIPAIPDSTQSGTILFDTFRAYTIDLEVQRRFCWRNWNMLGYLGVRHASASNDRNMWFQNTFGSDFLENQAFAGQQYNGTGLTFGVFGMRPLFCDDGALKVYFRNRYSVVWGNGQAVAQTEATAQNAVAFATSTDGALAIGDGGMFIAEVGWGLQWDTCLRCFPARAFFRTGMEWQYWDANAGVAVGSTSAADVVTASSYATTSAADLMFDMVGFTIGAGITY